MKNNVIEMRTSNVKNVANPSQPHDNGGTGGNGNMNNDKYVTHTELELSNQKMLRHMDGKFNQLEKKIDTNQTEANSKFESINTKFEEQKVWLLKELSATAIFIVTILGFLISIIALLK